MLNGKLKLELELKKEEKRERTDGRRKPKEEENIFPNADKYKCLVRVFISQCVL